MLLMCTSHFANAYFGRLGLTEAVAAVNRLTFAATPSFILISGVLLGALHFDHRANYNGVRRKFIDRALFLLTLAHLSLVLVNEPFYGLRGGLRVVFITDVVACCVLVGAFVVRVTRAHTRVICAISLYVIATLVHFLWLPPAGSTAQLLKHLLVEYRPSFESSALRANFPIAQWLAAYLLATVVGERLARSRARTGHPRVVSLVWLSASLLTGGAFLWASRPGLARWAIRDGSTDAGVVEFLTGWWQKFPPGPTYLFVYGGIALAIVAACLRLDAIRGNAIGLRALALMGRHSLFVFVAQSSVYALLFWLRLPFTPLWPLLFASTILLLGILTLLWQRADGRRFLTVGYPALSVWLERPSTGDRAIRPRVPGMRTAWLALSRASVRSRGPLA